MPHSAWLHSATTPSGSASSQDLLPLRLAQKSKPMKQSSKALNLNCNNGCGDD
jgi:hypothetical protein